MRTLLVRMACVVVCAVCMWCALCMYGWATTTSWSYARMVCAIPMMVCMVCAVVCACGAMEYKHH